jgi:hypothetical protein
VVEDKEDEEEDIDKRVLCVTWSFSDSKPNQLRPCSLSYTVLKMKLTFKAKESTKKCLIDKTLEILAIGMEKTEY